LRRRRLNSRPVHPDRLSDVLDLLIPEIIETQLQLVADVVARCAGDTNSARLCESFEAGCDVNAVAEQVLAVDDDIADVHADAELHRLVGGSAGIRSRNCCLHRDRALHSIDRAGEVSDDAVASGVEDAASVRRNQTVDDATAGLQLSVRADLVARHHPAVAGNVGSENRCELSFDGLPGHVWLLPTSL
jgi:hypothetical protein